MLLAPLRSAMAIALDMVVVLSRGLASADQVGLVQIVETSNAHKIAQGMEFVWMVFVPAWKIGKVWIVQAFFALLDVDHMASVWALANACARKDTQGSNALR